MNMRLKFRKRNFRTIPLFILIFVFNISYGFSEVIERPTSTAMSALIDPGIQSQSHRISSGDPRFLGLWYDPEFNLKLQLPFTDHPIGLSVDSSFTAGIIAAVVIILVTNAVTLTIISTISYFAHRWVREKKDALLGPFHLIKEHLSKKTLEVTQDFEKSMLLYRELAKKKARSKLRQRYKNYKTNKNNINNKNSRKIDVGNNNSNSKELLKSEEIGDSASLGSEELEELMNKIVNLTSTTTSTTTPRSINSTTITESTGWLTKFVKDLLLGFLPDLELGKNSTKTTTTPRSTTTPKLIPAKLIGIGHKFRPDDPSHIDEYSGYYQIIGQPGTIVKAPASAVQPTTAEDNTDTETVTESNPDSEKTKCLEDKKKKSLIQRVFIIC